MIELIVQFQSCLQGDEDEPTFHYSLSQSTAGNYEAYYNEYELKMVIQAGGSCSPRQCQNKRCLYYLFWAGR